MSKKLYVGNLPFSIGYNELKELFVSYGNITDAIVIANKFTGRSKGFGFITIEDDAMAKKAVAEMNEKDVQGRQITVTEARPMEEREERR